MFIASYASYLPVHSSTKSNQTDSKYISAEDTINQFTKHLQQQPESLQNFSQITPKYSLFEEAQKNKNILQFSTIKKRQDAEKAYSENIQLFPIMKKQKPILQKPFTTTLHLPKEAQSAKESILKKQMVNTYRENEDYYRITAA